MSSTQLFDKEFIKKLEYLSLVTRRIHRGRARGEHTTYKKGASLEFYDYRDYHAGDDHRYIDWNIWNRLNKVLVKLFTGEEDLTVHILLDTSRSMEYGNPSKMDYSKKLAAALAYIAVAKLDRVGVTSFSDNFGSSIPPIRRKNNAVSLFRFFESLKSGGTTDFNTALIKYAQTTRQRGVAIIISDLMDPKGYADGLLALLYSKFDIILLQVLADEELFPRMAGRIRLIDSETRGFLKVNIDSGMEKRYLAERDAFLKEIQSFSLSHGIEYLRTTTAIPFEDVVLKYLRQGMYLH